MYDPLLDPFRDARRPLLLDLFCGAGGAAMGYYRAGFDVVGVDNRPQPRYPFTFVQADALEYCRAYGRYFAAIHASPPCQLYSRTAKILEGKGLINRHPDLVSPTRVALQATRCPYVIENVPGAPLINPVELCGTQFSLRVYRHRLFESSMSLQGLPHVSHGRSAGKGILGIYAGRVEIKGSRRTPYVAGSGRTHYRPETVSLDEGARAMGMTKMGRPPQPNTMLHIVGHFSDVQAGREALGACWMTRDELSQAIPPAYTEYIGQQLLAYIASTRAQEVA